MRRIKGLIAAGTMIVMSVCGLSVVADGEVDIKSVEQINIETDQIDISEVEKDGFKSADDWTNNLQKRNSQFERQDLLHETIQKVLKERGTTGLNKYQYYQLLTEEKPESMSEDELLIVFNEEGKFSVEKYNQLFSVFEKENSYWIGRLKEAYDPTVLIELIGLLITDENVLFVQPNYKYDLSYSAYVTADYTYSLTRAMEQVKATDAWTYYTGKNVLVGLLDSGINAVAGQNLYNGCSVDQLSVLDNCFGHGTAVSAVIGGNFEYAGVAPDCTMHCTFKHTHTSEDDVSFGFTNDLATDIYNLVSKGCRIINMSIILKDIHLDVIREQTESVHSNVLFVQGAGNDHVDIDTYSVYKYYDYPNYIRVASVNTSDELSNFSNYGDERVHIAAPGEALSLPSQNGGMQAISGTSFATPFVSGTAALLLEANPTLTAPDLKDIILNSADIVPGLDSSVQAGRRLNVMAAVAMVNPPTAERYAYIAGGNLYARDNSNPTPILIDTNVKSVQLAATGIIYQKTNNYIYIRPETLTAGSTLIDNSGTAVSYFASWGNLVIFTGSQLKRYYYDGASIYDHYATHNNVKYYSLSGNRLVLFYTVSQKFRVYENIQTSSAYEIYTVRGEINALWSAGTRLHVYQNDGIYQLFASVAQSRPSEGYTDESGAELLDRLWLSEIAYWIDFSFICSMNENRWCFAEGNQLKIWESQGVEAFLDNTPTIISSPTGGAITSCKIVGYRIYFQVGSTWYAYEGDGSGTRYTLTSSAVSMVFCGDNIGYRTASNYFYVKSGTLTAAWKNYGMNASSIYLAN